MSDLLRQIKWQFLIFQKNNLLSMVIGMTIFYGVAIYFLQSFGDVEKFTTLIIFNEPTMVGFIFIGISIILEKDQEVLSALFITPINHHFYLLSRVITLSTISLICSWGIVLVAKGTSFNFLHFTIGAFFGCAMFSFVGIYVVSFTKDILHFTLRSIPIIIAMSLPFLNFFEFTDWFVLKLFPIQGSLNLIVNSYSSTPNTFELVFGYISLAIWIPLLYFFVYRTFKTRLVNQ